MNYHSGIQYDLNQTLFNLIIEGGKERTLESKLCGTVDNGVQSESFSSSIIIHFRQSKLTKVMTMDFVSQTWHTCICIWKVLINMAEFYEFMFLRMRKKGKAVDNNQQQQHH